MTRIMKNTLKYLLVTIASLVVFMALPALAVAQDQESTVKFDKKVSGPDDNGVYTISLEAYVTGSVTVTTNPAPADIVLVLDYSNSMTQNFGNSTRINALKDAVKEFVDVIKTNNSALLEANAQDDLGGHRIAVILYSGGVYESESYNNIHLNQFLPVEELKTSDKAVTYSGDNLSLLYPSTSVGTYSGTAMERAKSIIEEVDYSSCPDRTRVVVFFTDGVPGSGAGSSWNNTRITEANKCIKAAYDLKTSETHRTTVYSVGMFDAQATANQTTTYLSYTSSDFTDKTEMPSSGWVNVSGDKSIIVTSAGALSNVFSSIATSAGGNYSASSASSVLIDIVAASFSIPQDTDLGTVKVYQVACNQASSTSIISFSDTKEEITDEVNLVTDPDNGEVTVSGFDYGENWCGWDESANNNQGDPHGNKLVLEIPITVNEDAVGGPNVETNAPGSKLIIKDSDGNVISENEFISPTLKIPVSIWIQKEGLIGDDSAVFTIRRIKYKDVLDKEGNLIDLNKIANKDWDTFTKVTVNKKNMDKNGLVKISGLDPDYVYKLQEDAWSFGYQYQNNGTVYTVGDKVKNPFVIVNTPQEVKKAEAVVRNVFTEKEQEKE